jgi:RecA/RadA recombinase
MSDTQSLAAKMRERLNKRAGSQLAQEISKTEDLVQVEAWIDMPSWFQRATGARGLPVGHITQVIGKSDTGKTTIIMIAMVKVQKSGGVVYLIDSEHKFSFERFRLMGGIPEELVILPVESLEAAWNAFEIVNEDVADFRKKDKDTPILLIWDSVAASVPDAILEASAEQKHVSVDAKINNTEVRKIRKRIRDNKIAAFFINHSYMTMPKFGYAEEVVKGGSEMFFMSTLILKTKRRAWLKRTINKIDERFGVHSLLEVFKGHLGGSKATTPFYIVGQGVLDDADALEDYKDLIDGIDGPDINLLSLDQLREIRAARPAKAKKSKEEKPVKKAKKAAPQEEDESSDEEESEQSED